ncbi:MAG TPA: lysylphosphatidylglycerol synthase domain-containing protein [Chitinophagaceae bacterium]
MLLNLFLVLILMLANWSVEAIKWKLAVQKIQPVSFSKSLKAIFSGVSFSITTPNRVGEYLGRILYMEEGKRLKAISLTIVCSISQLLVTLFMGGLGLLLLMKKIAVSEMVSIIWIRVLLSGVFIVFVILTVFYFRLSWLVKWIDRIPASSRFAWLINTIEEFNATLLLKLLSLSLLRFFIFIIQYYLLFRLFGVDILWWQGFWSVSICFLILAIIPSIALADLGLRGQVTLKLLGLFSSNFLGISFTTATIWFINLVVPSIIGSLLIVSIKIFKNKK